MNNFWNKLQQGNNMGMQNSNPMTQIQEFMKFANSLQGQNPEQMVNELLSSGKMSPEQFEQLKQQANQGMGMINQMLGKFN